MKSDGLFKHLAIAFGIAVALYALAYFGIERQRKHQGPWQLTFTNNAAGAAVLLVNQPALAVTNVQIVFPGKAADTNVTLVFVEPRATPFSVPFGRCVFMDLTSLPGTLALELYGHQIQLIPRVLTIDQKERPWESNTTITLVETNQLQSPVTPTTSDHVR